MILITVLFLALIPHDVICIQHGLENAIWWGLATPLTLGTLPLYHYSQLSRRCRLHFSAEVCHHSDGCKWSQEKEKCDAGGFRQLLNDRHFKCRNAFISRAECLRNRSVCKWNEQKQECYASALHTYLHASQDLGRVRRPQWRGNEVRRAAAVGATGVLASQLKEFRSNDGRAVADMERAVIEALLVSIKNGNINAVKAILKGVRSWKVITEAEEDSGKEDMNDQEVNEVVKESSATSSASVWRREDPECKALQQAIQEGHQQILRLLLEEKYCQEPRGQEAALNKAVECDHTEVVQQLFHFFPSLTKSESQMDGRLIIQAMKSENVDLVRLLLQHQGRPQRLAYLLARETNKVALFRLLTKSPLRLTFEDCLMCARHGLIRVLKVDCVDLISGQERVQELARASVDADQVEVVEWLMSAMGGRVEGPMMQKARPDRGLFQVLWKQLLFEIGVKVAPTSVPQAAVSESPRKKERS